MITRYGRDDIGQLWRAHPKTDQPSHTVLEVMYPDTKPEWDLWDICNDDDMVYITDKMGIFWTDHVFEV